jgi:hypothetical protein
LSLLIFSSLHSCCLVTQILHSRAFYINL